MAGRRLNGARCWLSTLTFIRLSDGTVKGIPLREYMILPPLFIDLCFVPMQGNYSGINIYLLGALPIRLAFPICHTDLCTPFRAHVL